MTTRMRVVAKLDHATDPLKRTECTSSLQRFSPLHKTTVIASARSQLFLPSNRAVSIGIPKTAQDDPDRGCETFSHHHHPGFWLLEDVEKLKGHTETDKGAERLAP